MTAPSNQLNQWQAAIGRSAPESTKPAVGAAGFEGGKAEQLTGRSVATAQEIGKAGYFHTFGQSLLSNGYLIIPIKPGHKKPAISEWPTARLGQGDLLKFPGHGVGVLCGQGEHPICALDIDTTQPALAARFTAWCQDNLGATGERVGKAPKILMAYHAEGAGWGKATGALFSDNWVQHPTTGRWYAHGWKEIAGPDGAPKLVSIGQEHRLEVLGKGQQFVAYATHPDTGRPYEWVDLVGGIEALPAADLPVITASQVEKALQVFEQMAAEAGMTPKPGAAAGQGTRSMASHDGDDPLMAFEPRLGLSSEQLSKALNVIDPDMSHDDWLHVGMALHHETDGNGFAYWDTWSAGGCKYPGEDALRHRWSTFGGMAGRPVTARFLVKIANEAGADINPDDPASFEVEMTKSPAEKLRFQVVPAGEFSRGQPPGWIMKGVIPRAELVVLFGESGSGKSFLALDIGAAIARGVEWRGNRTKQGRVVYIAAEGGGGFRGRLKAYEMHHGISFDGLPFGIIHAAPNFLQKSDAVDVAKAILVGGKADLVIVDTFAQVLPGANENAAEDIGKALAHCRGIHKATGAVVLLVHHAGKDPTRGARGWSGLRAAADAELEVLRMPLGRMVRISKQKDGDDGREWGFDLETVPVGMDEDGDVIHSCTVVEAEMPMIGRVGTMGRRPMGKWERLVQAVMNEIAFSQTAGIEVDHVLAEVVLRAPPAEEGKRDTRKQHARRALTAMCEGDDALYILEGDSLSVL